MGASDPKDPTQTPLYGAPAKETGSAPNVPQPDFSKQDDIGEGSNSGGVIAETANPLYGATPSEPAREGVTDTSDERNAASHDGAKERLEASSRDRVRDLKAARENALAGSSSPSQASFQAPPGPSQHTDAHLPMTTPPPLIPLRPTHAPTPYRPSPLPGYLKRLSYILSILLGTGATIASIWSLFLLPLLHASFSARRALVEQQLERWTGLGAGLRQMRQKGMYALPPASAAEGEDRPGSATDGEKGRHSTALERSARAMVEEISSLASASGGEVDEQAHPPQPTPLLPDLSDVITSVEELAATRGNTSTTRTSLLSTLESYTSNLHRQLWSPRPGHGYSGYGVGLNSLDANLAKERGGITTESNGLHAAAGELAMGVKGEEYDAVRKEIRAIKGILLNRRNFDSAR